MFSRKNQAPAEPPKTRQKPRNLNQLGLLDVPDMSDLGSFGMDDDDDEDDDDLEAELMALQAGKDIRRFVGRPRLAESSDSSQIIKKANAIANDDDEDDDSDVNENDPELLNELGNLTSEIHNVPVMKPQISSQKPLPAARLVSPTETQTNVTASVLSSPNQAQSQLNSMVSLLEERLQMYRTAVNNAKAANDLAKTRRLERGLKAIEPMLKSAKAGKPIVEDDIPPPVATGAKPPVKPPPEPEPVPSAPPMFMDDEPAAPPIPPRMRPAPPPPTSLPIPLRPNIVPKEDISNVSEQEINVLTNRRDEYKQAALHAKHAGDQETTLKYIKIVKQFDKVIDAVNQGQTVDLSQMPPPPNYKETASRPQPAPVPVSRQPVLPPTVPLETSLLNYNQDEVATDEAHDPNVFNVPEAPTSTLEALQQRLQKYKSGLEEANASENPSKARRMGRIVKQYEDAIKAYKAGKPVVFDELPDPPGFPPIPRDNQPSNAKPVAHSISNIPTSSPSGQTAPSNSAPSPASSITSPPANKPNQVSPSAMNSTTPQRTTKRTSEGSVRKGPMSLHEKQMSALLERQNMFKTAALEAKKRGDIQAAKEYLRLAKGFAPMIEASKCGLPVNMDSMPTPPQMAQANNEFEIIEHGDCDNDSSRDEIFTKLEGELVHQIELCARTYKHYKALGDVANSKKFTTLLLNCKKDLDTLKYAYKQGNKMPRFHYEARTFSILQANTDVGENELELQIVRGISYSCPNPKDVDTYVKYEFPFPSEAYQLGKTNTVKDTNNPDYNAVFKIAINRGARAFLRVIKRHSMKLEVWAKGGFLRSDSLLGTTTVKLAQLETKCNLHNSFDLVDGRKPVGGKVEVLIRIHEPFLTKEIETINEKWLVID